MRILLMLATLMLGSAEGLKLYTVTVKTSPIFTDNTFKAYPVSNALRPKYTLQQDGDVATFKLPAGQYDFTAAEQDGLAQEYEGNHLAVNIKGNTAVVIPVKGYAVISKAGVTAFNGLLLSLNAVEIDCFDATVSDLCAIAENIRVKIVRDQIRSYKPFVQVQAWFAVQNQFIGRFNIGGKRYQLVLEQQEENTRLTFTQN
jgi:hypothetical protein